MTQLERLIVPESYNESIYEHITTLESCYQAMDEGVNDTFIINTAKSNSSLMLLELLDQAIRVIQNMIQRFIILLNNYILNNVSIIIKYRNVIVEYFKKIKDPIILHTYTYDKLGDLDYPHVIPATTIEGQIKNVQTKMMEDPEYTREEASYDMDSIMLDFTDHVIETPLYLKQLDTRLQEEIRKRYLGQSRLIKLTEKGVNDLLDELIAYKSWKNDIQKLKKRTLDEYKKLKAMYLDITTQNIQSKTKEMGYDNIKDLEKFNVLEYNRFSGFYQSMNEFLTGLIYVYQTSYTEKLKIMKAKINYNMEVISGIISVAGLFPSLNNKRSKGKKAVDFENINLKL